MRFKLLIIPVMMIQVANAQNGSASVTTSQATLTAPVTPASSTPVALPEASPVQASNSSTPSNILDYKSVYEAETIEEEVKMAGERFELNPSQQAVWLEAAADRRRSEKFAREKLDSKDPNLEKEGIYRGLRSAQNTFYETITGYLSPTQKQAFETDRLILNEKQKKLAKMPPAPPTPTITVAPVDSSAIKAETKKSKKGKKSKKKSS
jgi:hypothetical protein